MGIVETIILQISALIPPAFEVAFAVVALASAVAAITPTPRDDLWAGKAYKLLEFLALNIGLAKDAPANRKDEETQTN